MLFDNKNIKKSFQNLTKPFINVVNRLLTITSRLWLGEIWLKGKVMACAKRSISSSEGPGRHNLGLFRS